MSPSQTLRRVRPLATLVAAVALGAAVGIVAPLSLMAQAPAPKVEILPADYVVGPEDVIGVLVWREPDLSMDVTVRPDGHITLPLVNDVLVNGRTPGQVRDDLTQLFRAFVKEPSVTIIVREVKSRTVSITGQVVRPGTYPLLAPMRALELIARAGGLKPQADEKHLSVLRTDKGARLALPINYAEVSRGVRVWQDVVLRPGDTLVVP